MKESRCVDGGDAPTKFAYGLHLRKLGDKACFFLRQSFQLEDICRDEACRESVGCTLEELVSEVPKFCDIFRIYIKTLF